MRQLIVFITLFAVLTAAKTKSAEIIPVWNRTVEGEVQDMDFLKGQNEVLMLVGEGSSGQIQRRNPENGDLIHSFPQFMSSFTKLAITPDSLRFVHINGTDVTLRDISDNYSIMSTFSLSEMQEDSIIVYLTTVTVDPIRPNAYVTTYGWNKNTNNYAPRGKVIVYNYETGEHIKDLTPYGEYEYTAIEVSHDGRYLATLNDNKAYLKVWDLETMEQIINEPLFDENSDDWCESEDIYFSKFDDNVIYISGYFTKRISSKDIGDGAFKFFINNKKRELLLPEAIYASGNLIFLNQETIIFNSGSGFFGTLNLIENKLEYYDNPDNIYKEIVIFNNNNKYFIGSEGNRVVRFLYSGITDVNQNYEEEIVISPNPTGSFVNMNLNCSEPQINYQINDVNGLLLFQDNVPNPVGNSLQIDFTQYPNGIYFITLICNHIPKTYKIVKEG